MKLSQEEVTYGPSLQGYVGVSQAVEEKVRVQ